MAKPRATLKDIAARAGVSRYTVARVLNGETKGKWAVSAHRIELIHKLADEMGYRANAAARAVVTGRFNAAALLLPVEGNDYMPIGVIHALVAALAEHDMHLTVERIPAGELEDMDRLPKMLRELSVDGFFLSHATNMPQGLRSLLERGDQPAVWLNVRHRYDCVHPDDQRACRALVKRLVDGGHRRIAYLSPRHGPPMVEDRGRQGRVMLGWGPEPQHDPHYSQEARMAGYLAGCRACDIEPLIWEEGPAARDMVTAYARLLGDQRPDAVIAYGDRQAIFLIMAAERCGLRVPDDCSLATFDWEDHAVRSFGISAMDLPVDRYAASAVAMLMQKIAEPGERRPSRAQGYIWSDAGSVISR